MYSARLLNEGDYDELCRWWQWFRFPVIPKECLPENGCGGIMISKDGIDICAGFLYYTNSAMCWIEFIVSNPDYKSKDRGEAIRILIDELSADAKRNGFECIFTSVKNQSLIKHYEACGYRKKYNNTTEMIKIL